MTTTTPGTPPAPAAGERAPGGGLLAGKRLVITGVITNRSIAFAAARVAQEQGARIVLTGYGRMSLVELVARRLPEPPPVVELDVTDPEALAALPGAVGEHLDGVDGVLHSIAFAPPSCLGGFLTAPWEDVATAVHTSAYSYSALATALLPMMGPGGSVVGLTFDASQAWPAYDWMGVAKAALESANRYLARELGPHGVRSNLVAAGPLRTTAGRAIPGLARTQDDWAARAPLGWNVTDTEATARACAALLSDWFPSTTGEIVHVDGGYHAMGA
ncbi:MULTISPECIES: enoyl-ACP reductase FabI [unclassified Streptomyces]|uniref:enoyl-ACP reductase FabI n=1 Tax=unclassified Streptomyces TaxID=2593676 RepID=UPI00136D2C93|nr:MULTISPECIES: enoyl-ACP reductase FabI [unclassified Streptomyces]MCW5254570.1 enoyl-ACP reductase FabI [Streptomyces sp. SHP 1-2]MYU25776.1 enoyl-ACP reductase FabI [Streptomyces sp. SID8352]